MLKRILKVNVTWPGDSRCTHPSVWWFIFTWLLAGIIAAHPMSSVDAGWLLSLYTRISSCSWSGHNFLIGINDNMSSSLQLDGRTTHWFPVAECLWISAALLCYFCCPYAIWYTVLKPHRYTNASLLNSCEKVNILECDTTLKRLQLKLFILLLL